MIRARTVTLLLVAGPLAFNAIAGLAAESFESFRAFAAQYPLRPVEGYTFLGTEHSEEKPMVSFVGRIELWFDPAEHVAWLGKAMAAGMPNSWMDICRRSSTLGIFPVRSRPVK